MPKPHCKIEGHYSSNRNDGKERQKHPGKSKWYKKQISKARRRHIKRVAQILTKNIIS